jgi:hypothetical protein
MPQQWCGSLRDQHWHPSSKTRCWPPIWCWRLSRAAELVDHIEPDRTLQAEALALATHLDHPVYDCLFLVLARREVATLLSADQKLLELAGKVLP